nr:RNA-directed DNA polymerase, eukaryota [Tanacetum cinerariifolium]
ADFIGVGVGAAFHVLRYHYDTSTRWLYFDRLLNAKDDVEEFTMKLSTLEVKMHNEVINLWLTVEAYRVKLGKDIKNSPEHYMARLNQVLDPLSTSYKSIKSDKHQLQRLACKGISERLHMVFIASTKTNCPKIMGMTVEQIGKKIKEDWSRAMIQVRNISTKSDAHSFPFLIEPEVIFLFVVVECLNPKPDMLQSVSLMPYSDRWVWSLEGSGEFSAASIRKIIDDNRLSTVDTRTLLIKCVPIKVNVLA